MKNKKLIIAITTLSLTFLLSLSSLVTSFILFNNIKNNNSFLIGESYPSNNEGNNNDIYLDSSSLNVYQKINGIWTFKLSLNSSNNIKDNKEDESDIYKDNKVLHSVKVDNDVTMNGSLYVHKDSAYYKDTIIFLAKPINEEYKLDKLFFNDIEVNYEVSFIESYYLYSSIMVDEDVLVRGEFRMGVNIN